MRGKKVERQERDGGKEREKVRGFVYLKHEYNDIFIRQINGSVSLLMGLLYHSTV